MTTGRINQVVSGDEQGTPALTQAGRQPATAAAAAADAARQGAPEPSLTHRFGAGGNAFASPSPPAFTHRYISLSLSHWGPRCLLSGTRRSSERRNLKSDRRGLASAAVKPRRRRPPPSSLRLVPTLARKVERIRRQVGGSAA